MGDDDMLAAALRYAEAGFSCVPLVPGAKELDYRALGQAGARNRFWFPSWTPFLTRQPTRGQLEHWFSVPRNIGLTMGHRGLVAIDFDETEMYERWARAHPEVARTATVATQRGRHVYVRLEQPIVNSKLVFEGRTCGDVLSSRYVVAVPSLHPQGGRYAWLDGLTPWDAGIHEARRLDDLGVGQCLPRRVRHLRLLGRFCRHPVVFLRYVAYRLGWRSDNPWFEHHGRGADG